MSHCHRPCLQALRRAHADWARLWGLASTPAVWRNGDQRGDKVIRVERQATIKITYLLTNHRQTRKMYIKQCGIKRNTQYTVLRKLNAKEPHAGSGIIEPLRFLDGCRTRRLNQTLSVLSLSLIFWVSLVLLTSATFCVVLFVCSVSWLFLLGWQYQCKWLINWKNSSPK